VVAKEKCLPAQWTAFFYDKSANKFDEERSSSPRSIGFAESSDAAIWELGLLLGMKISWCPNSTFIEWSSTRILHLALRSGRPLSKLAVGLKLGHQCEPKTTKWKIKTRTTGAGFVESTPNALLVAHLFFMFFLDDPDKVINISDRKIFKISPYDFFFLG
jgi:hypothetical protein